MESKVPIWRIAITMLEIFLMRINTTFLTRTDRSYLCFKNNNLGNSLEWENMEERSFRLETPVTV